MEYAVEVYYSMCYQTVVRAKDEDHAEAKAVKELEEELKKNNDSYVEIISVDVDG